MKAAVVVANEDVQYQEVEEPQVTPGHVKIKVRYSGICGSDIPRVLNHGVHFYPIVLGHEFSGDVVEVGEGVTKVKVGDRVSGAPLLPCMKCDDCQKGNYSLCKHYSFIGSREQGANADYVVVPEKNAVPFADNVPYEQGAMFEPATVAIHGVFQNDYHGGEYVAILGGGTVGCETADYLAQEGALSAEKLYFMETQQAESPEKINRLLNQSRREITLVARGKIGANFDFGCAWPLLKDLRRLGVKQLPHTQVVDATDREVVVSIKDRKTGAVWEERLPCDTIVTAVGAVSDDALYQALKDGPTPVYCIGDAREVGKITGAIRQADDLALEL